MGIKDLLVKGKSYANEAAYYLKEKDRQLTNVIRRASDDYLEPAADVIVKASKKGAKKLEVAIPRMASDVNKGFNTAARRVKAFDTNMAKELAPAKRFSEGSRDYMEDMFYNKNKILVVSRRKDGTTVVNRFDNAVQAVNYIKAAKKIGHKIIHIKK
jgi:hypothetical protein